MENVPRNGSFVERRKVFVEYPFHSRNHQLPFDWRDQENLTKQKQRAKMKAEHNHRQVQHIYDMKMQQKLKRKFHIVDTFRAIPNQITQRKEQEEVLNRQMQQFEQSKLMQGQPPPSPTNTENPEYRNNSPHPSHQSAGQLHHKPRPNSRYQVPLQQHSLRYDSYRVPAGDSPSSSRQFSPEEYHHIYKLPYSNPIYGPSNLSQSRKYANLTNSKDISIDYPMRNYQPDQLQGFLRDKTIAERRRPFLGSMSLKGRNKD